MDNINRGDSDRRTRPYNLTLTKIPRETRDEFRRLTRPETYFEIRPNTRVGERAAYRVEMTPEEYERALRAAEVPASNLLTVNPDYICTADAPAVPGATELRYLVMDGAWSREVRGQGVRVAPLDSGVSYTERTVVASKSFVGENPLVDNNGHGTRMASLAVPPAAGLLVGQIASGGSAQTSNMAAGIYWAIENGAHVITMSYSGPGFDSTLEAAVKHAFDSDVIFFCSMGNHGTSEAYQPARYYQAHAIANFNSTTDSKEPSSATGAHVFLAATGNPVTWYNPDGTVSTVDNGGTSAAAALAGHAAALLLTRGYSKGNALRYLEAHARRTGASPDAEGAGVIQAGLAHEKIRENKPKKRRLNSGGSYDPVGPEPLNVGAGGSYPPSRIPALSYDPDPVSGKTAKDGCV